MCRDALYVNHGAPEPRMNTANPSNPRTLHQGFSSNPRTLHQGFSTR
jgi:hypothetical protein